MKTTLGELETRLLAYVQLRRLPAVRLGELAKPLRLTSTQERKLLSRLSQSGMIARVARGLYLVPPRLPLGGTWSPDEILALNTLMSDQDGTYQICGPNAFNRYGFDEQIPTRVYAYNNRLSCDRQIGTVSLTLIKVADERLGSTEKVKMPDGTVAVYSARARTLMDAVHDWSRFDTLPRAYEWIKRELKAKRTSPADLVDITVRFGNQGTLRRIGALLEKERVADFLLQKMERAINDSSSVIAFVPTKPRRGKNNQRWGVILNG